MFYIFFFIAGSSLSLSLSHAPFFPKGSIFIKCLKITDDQVLRTCKSNYIYFRDIFQQEGETLLEVQKRWAQHLHWEQQQQPQHLSLQSFAVARVSAQDCSLSSIWTTGIVPVLVILH